ncbi:MAG: hypothetical protein HQL28_03065 [Candidatus Omnitrophica bacterium]|nr:hypothetical protein [Candidatus Omnitrophota bacterium]
MKKIFVLLIFFFSQSVVTVFCASNDIDAKEPVINTVGTVVSDYGDEETPTTVDKSIAYIKSWTKRYHTRSMQRADLGI